MVNKNTEANTRLVQSERKIFRLYFTKTQKCQQMLNDIRQLSLFLQNLTVRYKKKSKYDDICHNLKAAGKCLS